MELKTLNGYGFDATKLGGLDAQYYAQGRAAHNLLDNSDFSNPIAQAGLNGMHGSTKYVCDRWISWDANATFGNGYITPGSPIDQHLSKTVVDINKTYTAAICLSDGTIKAESGTFSNGFGSYALGIYCMKQEGSTDYVTVRLNSGNNIRWAALYEGSYDASTLPAYQPKGYAAELAECKLYYMPLNHQLLGSGYTFPGGAALLVPRKMRIDAPSFVASGTIIARVNGADYPLTLSSVTTYGSMIKVDFASNNIPVKYPCAFYADVTGVSLNADM